MKKLIRRLRTRLRRLLGKMRVRSGFLIPFLRNTNPAQVIPTRPNALPLSGRSSNFDQDIWRHLQTAEAEEISVTRLALVHPRKYLRSLEACQPQPDKIYRIDDDTVMSHGSLKAARYATGLSFRR